MITKRKAVFSDFDGTLASGFITVDFIRWLAARSLISPRAFAKHEELMQDYRDKKIPYLQLVPRWTAAVAKCLCGLRKSDVEQWAKEFFAEWKTLNIYPSTRALIELLHQHDYYFFLITAGLDILISLLRAELQIDNGSGMQIAIDSLGLYTSEVYSNVHTEEGKAAAITNFALSYKIDPQKTMGFGDSLHDRAIFQNVKKPVALNPATELRALAEKEGWYIADHTNVLQVMNDCFAKAKNP